MNIPQGEVTFDTERRLLEQGGLLMQSRNSVFDAGTEHHHSIVAAHLPGYQVGHRGKSPLVSSNRVQKPAPVVRGIP